MNPVLLMLDEFPMLGRMDVLQTALAYLPGYGIRAYLIVQDLTQLAHALRTVRGDHLELPCARGFRRQQGRDRQAHLRRGAG